MTDQMIACGGRSIKYKSESNCEPKIAENDRNSQLNSEEILKKSRLRRTFRNFSPLGRPPQFLISTKESAPISPANSLKAIIPKAQSLTRYCKVTVCNLYGEGSGGFPLKSGGVSS